MGWSNSRQSWEERAGGAVLITAAACMLIWGTHLPALRQAILWALLLLTAALLLRRGWLKLFGPVLFYDMVRLARRDRYILLRFLYSGILLFALFMVWSSFTRYEELVSYHQYARMAEAYFYTFVIIQLTAVSLLTPAYVGGSIAEEKDRKTLEFMLATDLRNREIVLSKFVARIANLCMFMLIGLPMLSILQFLGGIDPNLLLLTFSATFATVIGLAGFSMLASVYLKKPRDAIFCSYLGPIVYVALGTVLEAIRRSGSFPGTAVPILGGPTLNDLIALFNVGNPIACFIELEMRFVRSMEIGDLMLSIWQRYVLFHVGLGTLCVGWSVARLRAVALKQSNEAPRKRLFRERRRKPVSTRPILWREMHVEGRARGSWLTRGLIFILLLITVGSGVWILGYHWIYEGFHHDSIDREMNGWATFVGTLVSCLVLLSVSVRAATCISGERDKDTFDFLLTTPLDSDTILWHKFLGCLFSFRWALVWLGMVWGLAMLAGGMGVLDVLLILVVLLVYASLFIMIGLWYSTTCRSSISATMWTAATVVILSVGHWVPSMCCFSLMRFDRSTEALAKCQAGMTPPLVICFAHFVPLEYRRHGMFHREEGEIVLACVVGVLLTALAAWIFWNVYLSPRFRTVTHRHDRYEPERRMPPHGPDGD